jgi:ferredoxin-NADP reductase
MRALFETLPVPGKALTLLYRASSPEEILFRDELEHVAHQRGARLIFLTGRVIGPAECDNRPQPLAGGSGSHIP